MEDLIIVDNLNRAKNYLVPYIFSENYFNILRKKLLDRKLSENERYYYSHFIKKKVQGMIELFGIDIGVNGKEFIRKDRLKRAINLLKKYSKKFKKRKVLISGSFLYGEKYNDIDIFVISKYNKDDYREGKVHVNYLPDDICGSLFFKSISEISISNFQFGKNIKEKFFLSDILHLYELVILLILQGDSFVSELRDLVLRMEYVFGSVILNSMQLKKIVDKIVRNRFSIEMINKYIISKVIFISGAKKVLSKFIDKNKIPEVGKKLYKNWEIYNKTYEEALEIVT